MDKAFTRFGYVSVAATNIKGSSAGVNQKSSVNVTFVATSVPGVTVAPSFAVRIRSSDAADSLLPATVRLIGSGVSITTIDAAASTVYVTVKSAPGAGVPLLFAVQASFGPV